MITYRAAASTDPVVAGNTTMVMDSLCTSMPSWMIERTSCATLELFPFSTQL